VQRRECSYTQPQQQQHRISEDIEKAVAKGNLTSSATSKWILALATKSCRRKMHSLHYLACCPPQEMQHATNTPERFLLIAFSVNPSWPS
jgi:hypothetical protein